MSNVNSAQKKRQQQKYVELIAQNWGLNTCKPTARCKICHEYANDEYNRRQLRNLYLTGLPMETISSLFDPKKKFTIKNITDHAARLAWPYKRSKIVSMEVDADTMMKMLVRRAEQSQDVVAGNSHDKALELMMRLKGLDQQKVKVEGDVQVSWEHIITKAVDKKATITLPDDDFSEVRLQELEDESAPAD